MYPVWYITYPFSGYPTTIDLYIGLSCEVIAIVLMTTAFATGGWRTKICSLVVGVPPLASLTEPVWRHLLYYNGVGLFERIAESGPRD